jgi:hypothetical protein
MGRGWKKSNWNSAAGCEFTVHFVVSKKVLRISLETSFDAIAVIAAGTDHLQEYVLGAIWVTGIIERLGKSPGQTDARIELADGQQSGVAGKLTLGRLDGERRAKKIEDLWPLGW